MTNKPPGMVVKCNNFRDYILIKINVFVANLFYSLLASLFFLNCAIPTVSCSIGDLVSDKTQRGRKDRLAVKSGDATNQSSGTISG